MQSEFLRFSNDLDNTLSNDLNLVAALFESTQQKIHGLECLRTKRIKIQQFQHLVTDLIDKHHRSGTNNRVLSDMSLRLQALRDRHPRYFNNHYPAPLFTFNQFKNTRKALLEEIRQYLQKIELDKHLREILSDYFSFRLWQSHNHAPTWNELDYYHTISSRIIFLFKNLNTDDLELSLIQFFVRYNFNINSINDYYTFKINYYLKDKKNGKALMQRLADILQVKPLKNMAYDHSFKSLHEDLNDLLETTQERMNIGTYPLNFPRYNKNTEIRMLFRRLMANSGYCEPPKALDNFYEYLSKYTRGIKGNLVTAKSFENGTRITTLDTYNEVEDILKEMLNQNELERQFTEKKMMRLTKRHVLTRSLQDSH